MQKRSMANARRLFLAVLVVGTVTFSLGQTPTAKTSQPKPVSKPPAAKPRYLAGPLDLATSNLGPDFQGHDIAALYNLVKESPALKPKSEFETTSLFETRRNSFANQPLLGNLTAGGTFAFVVSDDSFVFGPQFNYDADSQTLAFSLPGRSITFFLETDHPELDSVLIRSTVLDRGSYMASNAFGATVKVDKTYSRDIGVAFSKDTWLFRSSDQFDRKFTHVFTLTPDQAKVVKTDGKVLLICRLVEPWFRETVHGHEAKIDEPYETTVRDNYLQVVPEQLWIFNRKTGEVVSKLSESSIASSQDEQLRIKLKQTPLIVEVSSPSGFLYKIAIDGKPDNSNYFEGKMKTFEAQHRIVFTIEQPDRLADITFKVNGQPYTPDWSKDAIKIGNYESVHSATAVITIP